jgi:predicted porin
VRANAPARRRTGRPGFQVLAHWQFISEEEFMLHRKKLLAIALATAAGVPALAQAQTGNVVLYGKLYPEMVWAHGTGGTSPGTHVSTLAGALSPDGSTSNIYGLAAANSRLGVRGQEKISSDLTAIFQIEQTIPVDAGGGTLANRDTFVGLESEHWGTVKLGNFDTVYKNLGDTLSFLGISSGNFVSNSNILSKAPMGSNSSGSFHLRRANSVQYESPDFKGFGVLAQYSPDEAKTTSRNADLISVGVQYENGPLYAAIAHEQHRDLFGGSRNSPSSLSNFANLDARSKDRATRLALRYAFGNTTVEGDIARLEYKETGGLTGRFASYKKNAYLVSMDHRMGNWRLAASYTWANDGSCSLVNAECSADGLGGSQVSLGASYSLSKRTQIFLIGAVLNNDKSARYNNSDFIDPTPGMDISQVALGLSHTF